jgi:hypothetical protein
MWGCGGGECVVKYCGRWIDFGLLDAFVMFFVKPTLTPEWGTHALGSEEPQMKQIELGMNSCPVAGFLLTRSTGSMEPSTT